MVGEIGPDHGGDEQVRVHVLIKGCGLSGAFVSRMKMISLEDIGMLINTSAIFLCHLNLEVRHNLVREQVHTNNTKIFLISKVLDI